MKPTQNFSMCETFVTTLQHLYCLNTDPCLDTLHFGCQLFVSYITFFTQNILLLKE